MKKLFNLISLFFIFTLFSWTAVAQHSDLIWVSQLTGSGQCIPVATAKDGIGNVYVTGTFTLDLSSGATTLNSAGGADVFIAKFNSAGTLLWLVKAGGVAAENVGGIAVSNDGSAVYVSGMFAGTCNFGGGITQTSAGSNDLYLASYDATDGSINWANNTAYGLGNHLFGSISLDSDGNLVQVGNFFTDVTFNGGAITLIAPSALRQSFIAKYDALGNTIWANMIVGDNSNNTFRTVRAYEYGYYVTGLYQGTLTFDVGAVSNAGTNLDMFVYKCDLDGNGLWVRKIVGTGDDYIWRHSVDNSGNVFLAGYYNSPTLTIDSTATLTSSGTYANQGNNDVLFAKYYNDGTLAFAKSYGGPGDDKGFAVYTNGAQIAVGGSYTNTFSLGSFTLPVATATDAFLAEFDCSGNVLNATRASGTSTESLVASLIDNNNCNLYIGEFYSNPASIGSVSLTNPNTATRDMFIAKFGQIILTFAVTDVLCNGDLTGAVDLTVSGDGTGPYTFSWAGPGAYTSTSEDITALEAGWYTVTVTNAIGTTKVDSALVSQPNAIAAVFGVVNTSCSGNADGAINLSPTGGASPYSFAWSNGDATEDIANLDQGWYTVTITDLNACTFVDSARVSYPAAMALSGTVTVPTCVPGSDGAVDLTVVNGTLPLTFAWTTGAVTEDISGLISGNYDVTVTDDNGCTATATFAVANPSAPSLSYNKTNPTCVPGTDGEIDVIVTGGTAPFTYAWGDGPVTEDRTGLSAGSYSIIVTDDNNCAATIPAIVLTDPAAPSISFISVNPSCIPGTDGTIDLIVSGGTAPFTYLWDDGAATEDRTALADATYLVTVTDAYGCTANGGVTLILDYPDATITATGVTTFCSGGSVLLTANTGTGLSYQWQADGVDIAGAIASVYSATIDADYTVVVTDALGCSATSAITVVTVNAAPALYAITGGGSYCTGGTAPSVGLAGSDLTVNYELFLDGVTTTTILAGTGAALDFGAQATSGTYTIVATDVSTCTATMTGSAVVTENALPTATITASGATTFCAGGSVILTATVGAGYTYQWQADGVDITGAVTSAYTATADADYTVVVSDLNGCSATSVATIVTVTTAPVLTVVTTSPSCVPGTDGTVDLTVTGGTAPITFLWDDAGASTTEDLAGLVAGVYTVTVTDASLCTAVISATVSAPVPPVAAFVITNETCAGNDGQIDLTVTGNGPFTFTWDDPATSTTEDITALASGTYRVTITDAGFCTKVDSATVAGISALTAVLDNHTLIVFCPAGTNGEATVTTTGGSAPLTFAWSGSASVTATATDLGVGWQFVSVTDACGTTVVDSLMITSLPGLNASISASTPANCAASADGTVSVTATDGISPYTFAWSGSASTTSDANDLLPGWQYVTITDYCGSIVDSIEIMSLPAMSIDILTSTPIWCTGDENGTATVTVTDGVGPFTYLWSSAETTVDADSLPIGWQYVTVTDFCGSLIDSVQIGITVPLTIDITFSSPASCLGGNNGSALVTTTNGAGTIVYLWTSGNTSANATDLTTGWQYVTVTDACQSLIDSVEIAALPILTADITFSVDASCPTTLDGKATVTASDGAAPYTYAWSGSASTGFVAMDLGVGWQYVTVSDACGSVVDSVAISSKPALMASISVEDPATCAADSNGVALAMTMNGVMPFTYEWSESADTDSLASDLPAIYQYVVVTDICGSDTVYFTMTSNPLLSLDFEKENVACFGQANGEVVVTPMDGSGPFTFVWADTVLTDSMRTNLAAGIYYVTVTDLCGSVNDSIVVSQPGTLSPSIIPENVTFTGMLDGAADLIVSGGTAPFTFLWSNSTVMEDLTGIGEGTYSVIITDDNGCVANDTVVISTDVLNIIIRNAFTPNGDGKNDVWNIEYIQAFPECVVLIYNEWGQKVFESTGYSVPWDGAKEGKELPAATYYYIIDLKDGSQPFTGSVTIIR